MRKVRLDQELFDRSSCAETSALIHVATCQAIDAGGVAREWFTCVINSLFNVEFGLFKYGQDQLCFQINEFSGLLHQRFSEWLLPDQYLLIVRAVAALFDSPYLTHALNRLPMH